MILQVPITEAVELIKQKSGKTVMLKVVNDNTITIGYEINVKVPLIGIVSKKVNVNVTIDKVEKEDVYLHYAIGMPGGDAIVNSLLSLFANDIRIVDKCDNNGLVLHLREIEQARKGLEYVEIKSISFGTDLILVDFKMKE
jgi:hypothetical protein